MNICYTLESTIQCQMYQNFQNRRHAYAKIMNKTIINEYLQYLQTLIQQHKQCNVKLINGRVHQNLRWIFVIYKKTAQIRW